MSGISQPPHGMRIAVCCRMILAPTAHDRCHAICIICIVASLIRVASEVQICYERETGKPLGYAVVHFTESAAAQNAINVLNNAQVDGRQIVVAPYRPRVGGQGDRPPPRRHPTGPAGPALDEAFGLVLDLHKHATWMCAFRTACC